MHRVKEVDLLTQHIIESTATWRNARTTYGSRDDRVPPPPPPSSERPVAFYDTECYPNYWLLKLRPRGGEVYSFRAPLSKEDVRRVGLLFDAYTVVSFNGIRYDVPMITAALMGYDCAQLKWMNDRIIVDKVKHWELGLPEWQPSDHIDIMEVIPGDGSQKLFAGRIHYKTMRDLPYDPSTALTPEQIANVDDYCENDLGQLEALYDAVWPQIKLRKKMSEREGMDLRSKSDAQLSEAVIKRRIEMATGERKWKPNIDRMHAFRYRVPEFIAFSTPQMIRVLDLVKESVFRLNRPNPMAPRGQKGRAVAMPPQLEGLKVTIGQTTYSIGIGGLHSADSSRAVEADDDHIIRDADVRGYYPNQMLKSGEYPPALGVPFLVEFKRVVDDREVCKALVKKLEPGTEEYEDAAAGNDGGKIMSNGTFGKTGSPHSILWAPEMMIQTTLNGQLSLLMLIEWHEHYGIPIISANTDGIVMHCRKDMVHISDALIAEWEKRTGLEMEFTNYRGLYSRDINNYFAVKLDGEVKRKGDYAKCSLIGKKSPDVEICSDAVADYLANGTPILYTISACRDIRKFVTIQKVAGGAVKMWGEGPRKGALVRDMAATLLANGWVKDGRKWRKGDTVTDPTTAYGTCFAPQRPEPLGKVIRWYYGTRSPGPIVYESNGNLVGGSYGATPCMTLPDEFPDDIDYGWYVAKAEQILLDVGK